MIVRVSTRNVNDVEFLTFTCGVCTSSGNLQVKAEVVRSLGTKPTAESGEMPDRGVWVTFKCSGCGATRRGKWPTEWDVSSAM